jgi:hypothetical protein
MPLRHIYMIANFPGLVHIYRHHNKKWWIKQELWTQNSPIREMKNTSFDWNYIDIYNNQLIYRMNTSKLENTMKNMKSV